MPLSAGQKLGPYEILAPIGAGGMGQVWKARDTRLDRIVAIKVSKTEFSERFEREARAASALNHPNICTVYDIGETGGQAYLVMEYLEGQTLAERLKMGPLAVNDLLDFAIQICDALDAAHSHGIIHRDIKPANIFIDQRHQAKVMDFGLAKMHGPAGEDAETVAVLTQAGVAIGTLAYMSPEQARGEDLDARTDIFSLGVMLYEMATGSRPFRGSTTATIFDSILNRDPIPPHQLREELPARFDEIISKTLEKDRVRRFQKSSEILAALRNLAHELESGPTRVRMPNRKHALLYAMAALLMVTVAAIGYRKFLAAPVSKIRSLAVVPFENRSGDSSKELVDGFTDALTADLARIQALRVSPVYRGEKKTIPDIGRETNAEALLGGTVARSEDRIRITAELTEVSSNRHLWSETYERNANDLFAVQGEVARAVSDAIRVQLTAPEQKRLADPRTVNPKAYDLYLRGLSHAGRDDEKDIDQAIALLEQSADLDPSFEPTQANLALVYGNKSFFFSPNDPQWDEKGYAAVQRALALDPNAPEAHYAQAVLIWRPSHGFPNREALAELRQAVTSDPNFGQAWHYHGVIMFHVGHLEGGLNDIRKALRINPANTLARFRLGPILVYQGKYEEAIAALDRVPREVAPANWAYQRAWSLIALGRLSEAARQLEDALKENAADQGGLMHSARAMLRARHGDRAGAEADIAEAIRIGKNFGHFHHTEYSIAAVYSLLGDFNRAEEWIEKAANDGFPCYTLFESDQSLAPLRATPRFRAFLSKLRQEWAHIPGEPE